MIENIDFANPVIQIISVLLGIVILVSGRKLFWLAVGAIGFVIGLGVVFDLLANQPAWIAWAGALLAGAVGALLAILLQKVAVSVAGFLIGGYTLVWIVLQLLNLNFDRWELLIFIVGGIAGGVLVTFLFELALIILSSLVGATLIVQAIQSFNFHPIISAALFLVLLVAGFAAQSKSLSQQSANH